MGEYRKSNTIYNSRKSLKLTRAKLSDGICDELTLLRYEKGLLDPSDEVFFNLMTRMGMDGDLYMLPFTQENIEYISIQGKINNALQRDDYEECAIYLDELVNNKAFDTTVPENKLYVERIRAGIDHSLGKLSAQEYIDRLTSLIRATIPDFSTDNLPENRILSNTEIRLLGGIATAYARNNDFDTAFLIYESFISLLKLNDHADTAKPVYTTLLNYSNYLGRQKKYDKCIEVCELGLEFLFGRECQNLLYNFYYNIGWVYLMKSKEGIDTENNKKQAKVYFWLAYSLCDFYNESQSALKRMYEHYISLN